MDLRTALVVAFVLATLAPSEALYEDQAGLFDWHKRVVGVPFDASSDGKRVFVATESNAIAALDALSGDVVWRHVLGESEDDALNAFVHGGGALLTLSGGRRFLRRWDEKTGALAWEALLFSLSQRTAVPSERSLRSDGLSGMSSAAYVPSQKAVVVASGAGLQLRRVVDGSLVWATPLSCPSWLVSVAAEGSSDAIVATCADASAKALAYATVDPATGAVRVQGSVPVPESLDSASVVAVDSKGVLLSTSSGAVSFVDISGSSASLTPRGNVGATGTALLNRGGARVVASDTKSGHSSVLGADGTVARDVEGLACVAGSKLVVLSAGAKGSLSWSIVEEDGRTSAKGAVSIPSPATGTLQPIRVFCDQGARAALAVLSDGSVARFETSTYSTNAALWVRDEGLAEISAVEFVDLPARGIESLEREFSHEHNAHAAASNIVSLFVNRISTQLSQLVSTLSRLPDVLGALASRPLSSSDDGKGGMTRDQFNLRRVVVAATRRGAVFGIHGDTGSVLWRALPEALAVPSHGAKVALLRSAVHFPAVAAVVGAGGVSVFDPLTGAASAESKGFVLQGKKVLQSVVLPDVDAHSVHVLVALDSELKVHVVPDNAEARAAAAAHPDGVFVHTIDTTACKIDGYKIGASLSASLVWTVRPCDPSAGERIVAVSRSPSYVRSASVGRVLGDRSVLYKPLSAGLFGVFVGRATDSTPCRHVDAPGATFAVVDSVSGEIVTRESHPTAKGPLAAAIAENWVVYSTYNAKLRRTELVAMEVYDDAESVRNTSITTSLEGRHHWRILTQAYVIGSVVRTLAITTTERGITNRQLLLGLANGQVVGVDRRFVDPRRPPSQPTAEEAEEGVVMYQPEIPLPPQWCLNYNKAVSHARGIATAPSGLESTCLVFAYGMDLFYTRVTPSKPFDVLNDDFNFPLLLLTVAGLSIGWVVTAHMAKAKQVRRQWK